MRRIVLEVEYHGQAFFGWQRQGKRRSVQGVLEAAIADLAGERADVHGAGRTDRGVHALAMPCHVDLESRLTCAEIMMALNARLPADCAVRRARQADSRFHARFDARSKLYRYRLVTGRARSPMLADRACHAPRMLDLRAMQEAVALLAGTHDFASFRTNPDDEAGDDDGPEITADQYGPAALAGGDDKPPPWRKPRPRGTVRTILRASVARRGRMIGIYVRGDGFLRGMVRAIAGSLLEVGLRKQPPAWIAHLLSARDRREAGANLPPHGLTLVRVDYPSEPFSGLDSSS